MQFQSYEDYMRSVLGYPRVNMYEDEYMYYQMPYEMQARNNNYEINNKIEELYPEIYITINPMVKSAIEKYNITNTTCTKEILDRMTEEIYTNIETSEMALNREADNTNNRAKETENRQISRQNNRILKDLIRILILTNLINRRRPRPSPYYRPPYPRVGYNEF